jgi:hypothetical protein
MSALFTAAGDGDVEQVKKYKKNKGVKNDRRKQNFS